MRSPASANRGPGFLEIGGEQVAAIKEHDIRELYYRGLDRTQYAGNLVCLATDRDDAGKLQVGAAIRVVLYEGDSRRPTGRVILDATVTKVLDPLLNATPLTVALEVSSTGTPKREGPAT